MHDKSCDPNRLEAHTGSTIVLGHPPLPLDSPSSRSSEFGLCFDAQDRPGALCNGVFTLLAAGQIHNCAGKNLLFLDGRRIRLFDEACSMNSSIFIPSGMQLKVLTGTFILTDIAPDESDESMAH